MLSYGSRGTTVFFLARTEPHCTVPYNVPNGCHRGEEKRAHPGVYTTYV